MKTTNISENKTDLQGVVGPSQGYSKAPPWQLLKITILFINFHNYCVKMGSQALKLAFTGTFAPKQGQIAV